MLEVTIVLAGMTGIAALIWLMFFSNIPPPSKRNIHTRLENGSPPEDGGLDDTGDENG